MEIKNTFLNKHIGLIVFHIILSLGWSTCAYAQNANRSIKLFEIDRVQELNWKSLRSNKNVRIFTYDQNQYQSLKAERPVKLALSIPTPDGDLELDLVANQVLSEDFVLSTDKQRNLSYTPGLYYKGVIKGTSNTLVAISLFEHDVMGVISQPGHGNLVIGTSNALRRNSFMLFNDSEIDQPSFDCKTEELPSWIEQIKPGGLRSQVAAKCVNVYFEVGNSVYTNKGSETATADFISGIFNGTSSIYGGESINTSISEIHIWTSQEPHGSGLGFGNTIGNFNGNLAHYVRMATGNSASGIAYAPGLCGSPYAYSEVFPSYSYPSYSWSVNVITHEMGHNLGSSHTQSCTWPGGAIDGCVTPEGSCAKGPIPGPGGGTIMSYCHQNSSVGINFANGFGPLPGDKIRTIVNNASCVSANCGSGGSSGGGGGGGGTTPADLRTTAVGISPSSLSSVGQGFSVSFTISNFGGNAANSIGRVYFSDDATLSANDQTILNISVPGLNTATGVNGSFNTTLPSGTTAGTYYYIICADAPNTITESSESNNCNQASITLNPSSTPQSFPDLILAVSSTIPTVISAGQKIDITGTVSNAGNAVAGSSALSIMFSTDDVYSSNDVNLYTNSLIILNANANTAFSSTVTIPTPLNTSSYFIIVCADANSAVVESNENNNCRTYAVSLQPVVEKPKPDLSITTLKLSQSTAPTGNPFTVNFTTSNSAQEPAAAFSSAIFLSNDTNYDSADSILKVFNAPTGLAAGASTSNEGLIDQKIKPGNYYIIVCADHKGVVAESNEFNNCTSIALTISNPIPDLVIDHLEVVSEMLVNQSYPIHIRIKNIGNKKTEISTSGLLYLATNNFIEKNSILIGTVFIPTLEIDGTKDTVFNFTPLDNSEGPKYLILCVDPSNKIVESNENNNCVTKDINITLPLPDLKAQSQASMSNSIGRGSAFVFPFKMANIGVIASNPVVTEYYISSKPLLKSSGAFKLLIDSVPGLKAGEEFDKNVTLQLPPAATQGTYYLNICIDYNNKLKESSKINNCQSIRFVIRKALADLEIKSFGVINPNTPISSNTPFNINLQISNSAELLAVHAGVKVSYYSKASKDVIITAKYFLDTLHPGAKKDTIFTTLIPVVEQGKEYYFEVELDENKEIEESNESNNNASFSITAPIALGDITLQLLHAPDTQAQSGQEFSVQYRLVNPGLGKIDSFKLISRLSDSAESATYLTQVVSIHPLNTGEEDTITLNYILPQALPNGIYRLSTIADPENVQPELDESNNFSVLPIQVIQSLPDLAIQDIRITDSIHKGMGFTAKVWIKNQGTWTIPNTQDSLFLSNDLIASEDDVRISALDIPVLFPKDTFLQACTILIPYDMKTGLYYLIVTLDGANRFQELNELNNTQSYPIYIPNQKADLELSGIRLSKPGVTQGQAIDITELVRNSGETPTGKFEISYILKGNLSDSTPTLSLPNVNIIESIDGQKNIEIRSQLNIPDFTPPGFYSLISCLDAKNEIDEMSHANNCGQILIEVTKKSSLSTALPSTKLFYNLSLYPNPVSHILHLEGENKNLNDKIEVQILDYTGRRILKDQFKSLQSLQYDLDVHHLNTGIYILELTSTHGSWKKQFIKL